MIHKNCFKQALDQFQFIFPTISLAKFEAKNMSLEDTLNVLFCLDSP